MVRQYMASWDAWGRDRRCAVLMIAHPPKGSRRPAPAPMTGGTVWFDGLARRGPECLGATPCKGDRRGPEKAGAAGAHLVGRAMKASYGPAPDPVHLAADGVTWRATLGAETGGARRHGERCPQGGRGKCRLIGVDPDETAGRGRRPPRSCASAGPRHLGKGARRRRVPTRSNPNVCRPSRALIPARCCAGGRRDK